MAFEFIFTTDVKEQENLLREKSEKRLTKLGLRYDAVTGADVNIKKEVKGNTPHLYRASVVISTKPKRIAAVKKHEKAWPALKEALDAVERQLKEILEKMQRPWEDPDDPSKKLKEEFTE